MYFAYCILLGHGHYTHVRHIIIINQKSPSNILSSTIFYCKQKNLFPCIIIIINISKYINFSLRVKCELKLHTRKSHQHYNTAEICSFVLLSLTLIDNCSSFSICQIMSNLQRYITQGRKSLENNVWYY